MDVNGFLLMKNGRMGYSGAQEKNIRFHSDLTRTGEFSRVNQRLSAKVESDSQNPIMCVRGDS